MGVGVGEGIWVGIGVRVGDGVEVGEDGTIGVKVAAAVGVTVGTTVGWGLQAVKKTNTRRLTVKSICDFITFTPTIYLNGCGELTVKSGLSVYLIWCDNIFLPLFPPETFLHKERLTREGVQLRIIHQAGVG